MLQSVQTIWVPINHFQPGLMHFGQNGSRPMKSRLNSGNPQTPEGSTAKPVASSEAIDETVGRLKKLGFLDDRKLAEQYASSLARNRAFGRLRVERELRVRRLDPRTVQPALNVAFEETDERALLQR